MSSRSWADKSLCFLLFNRWWSNRRIHLLQSVHGSGNGYPCLLLRHHKYMTLNSLFFFKLLLSSYLCWILRCILSLSLITLPHSGHCTTISPCTTICFLYIYPSKYCFISCFTLHSFCFSWWASFLFFWILSTQRCRFLVVFFKSVLLSNKSPPKA